jgi:hypothetical protein
VGGLYYIAVAVLLPIRAAFRNTGERWTRSRWRRAIGTATLALAVFAGMWATGWLLGVVLTPLIRSMASRHDLITGRGENLLRWAVLLSSTVTLLFLLTGVQIVRMTVERRRKRHGLGPRSSGALRTVGLTNSSADRY